MTAPHILDTAGREAFRLELIEQAKKLGIKLADSASIEEARLAIQRFPEKGSVSEQPKNDPEPSPPREQKYARRTAAESHTKKR